MSSPRIGRMRQRMTLQQAVRAPDGGGGATVTWTPVADVWAALVPIGGDERVDADALQGRASHEIWIRFRADAAPQMRFVFGTRVFDIRSVTDVDEAHRFQRCLTDERLP
jgi:SPP1 family predicted phage head-tail adaptor